MTREYTILFVHGFKTSSRRNWYPFIVQALRKSGVNFLIPNLPNSHKPDLKQWLRVIDRLVEQVHGPLILVGHSLGCRAVLHYLEQTNKVVDEVLLICGFNDDLIHASRHEGYETFFDHQLDYQVIKQKVGKFTLMHSVEDGNFPYHWSEEMAYRLDGTLLTYHGNDHFCDLKDGAPVLETLRSLMSPQPTLLPEISDQLIRETFVTNSLLGDVVLPSTEA